MKLESLKSSKFEAFKENELLNTINIIGGKLYLTRKVGASEFSDCWDDSCGDDIHSADGTRHFDVCPTQAMQVDEEEEIGIEGADGDEMYIIGWEN